MSLILIVVKHYTKALPSAGHKHGLLAMKFQTIKYFLIRLLKSLSKSCLFWPGVVVPPIIPAPREAEAGESPEVMSSRPA